MEKLRIRNVLVPIDFSKMSIDAIAAAKRLSRRFGGTVHLVHVYQFDYLPEFTAPAIWSMQASIAIEEQYTQLLKKKLAAVAQKNALSPVNCHLLRGTAAFDEICRLARDLPADLILLPTHGRTGLKRVFLGSTAERVVQHSPCPVFVVRKKKRLSKGEGLFSIRTLLVPVDFSGRSREGLQYAIEIADKFGARIIVLHATYLGYIYSAEGTAFYDVPALQEAARRKAKRQMRKFLRTVRFGRVPFETAITEGSPAHDICASAKANDVDLIVTSTHGLTGLKHVLIGSVAEQVVRRAPCSVLVAPSHPRVRAANLETKQEKPLENLAARAKPRLPVKGKALTKKDRKLAAHPFPERRKTNKFRESHSNR
ncbi:MAG: universal stress protein [Chthoniobacterales bacterium]|jgi:nucleotide-binding universal stress UspA family protein|nr:universal stress protein [Chthoniobacterales bacterium]